MFFTELNTLQKVEYTLQHSKDSTDVLVHMIRNKPIEVMHGMVKAIVMAGVHISDIMRIVNRAECTGSLILATMAVGLALNDPGLTANRAKTAIRVCIRNSEFMPCNINYISIFVKVLRLCSEEASFSWNCFEAVVELLETVTDGLSGLTDHTTQLVAGLYQASPKMISVLDANIMHLIVPVAVMLFGIKPACTDVQQMAYDWIVALERYLRHAERDQLKYAMRALVFFLEIDQVSFRERIYSKLSNNAHHLTRYPIPCY